MLRKSVVGACKNDTDEINEHSDLSDDHGLNLEIPELRLYASHF